jgi:hypothetical protein
MLWLGEWFFFIFVWDRDFLIVTASRLFLESTQPHIQWVPYGFLTGMKRSEAEVTIQFNFVSSQECVEFYHSSPIRMCGVLLN